MDVIPFKVQLISIIGVLIFMYVVLRLIVRGKLREEYSIMWILGTIVLVVFSIWRQGLQDIATLLNVSYAPSLLFLIAIFAIICFLLHLSIVVSRLQAQIKDMAYELAILKQEQTPQGNAGKGVSNEAGSTTLDGQARRSGAQSDGNLPDEPASFITKSDTVHQ